MNSIQMAKHTRMKSRRPACRPGSSRSPPSTLSHRPHDGLPLHQRISTAHSTLACPPDLRL
ncbi:hypothetical protein C8Q73DRAFT_714347 [Cubamyces lactineus]|nr:hypothetical protein C8Q73DRAFT_714347 [Cubamyces lactineus]